MEITEEQIIADALEIRKSLFMWKMSLEQVDRILLTFGYDISTLEQYDFSNVDYSTTHQQSSK